MGFQKQRVIYFGWVLLRHTEDNYGRLIDFLGQIKKLFNFNVLNLADFVIHH